MKFVSFATAALPKPHLGLVQDDEVLDLDLAARALTIIFPDQMLDLIDDWERAQSGLEAIFAKAAGRRFSEVKTFTSAGAVQPLAEVQLYAPIPRPRKNIMCLGLNYSEHVQESAGGTRSGRRPFPSIPLFSPRHRRPPMARTRPS